MQKNKLLVAFSHLLVWLVLVSIPYVLSYGENQNIYRVIAHFWVPIVFFAAIFYLNFFVLIDRFLFTKKLGLFIGINLLMMVFFIAMKEQIETAFFEDLIPQPPQRNAEPPSKKMILYIQMLSNMAPLLFAIAIKTTKRWIQDEAKRKEAANYQLQSELQYLRYQLQPHFFFNSLNNIYALVDLSPERAKTSIHGLSKLMRYLLYETNTDTVPLTKEIAFMTNYIELMKLRLSDKTTVHFVFPEEETGISVAPLLFISLIENAFKHGVSAVQASTIAVNLEVKDDNLFFSIENGNFPKQNSDHSGSGIGLHNLQNRLNLLYPDKHRLTIEATKKTFKVNLELTSS